MAEKLCELKKKGGGSGADARLGYVYRRDNSSAKITKSILTAGVNYNATVYGMVAFVDKSYTVSRYNGNAGFAILYSDGTYVSNNATATAVSKGDIVFVGGNCGLIFN